MNTIIDHSIQYGAHVMNSVIILFFTTLFVTLSFSKKIRYSKTWCATVTPLASIIGSGFLVVTPLFALIFGKNALFAITTLVCVAYLMGSVVRFNIKYLEPHSQQVDKNNFLVKTLARSAYLFLGLAYLVSISFYIKLLSLFVLRGFHFQNELIANCIATGILVFIGVVGKIRGFKRLELLEEYSVNIKLSIIFSMMIGLILYNFSLILTNGWHLNLETPVFNMKAMRELLGTLIIIQGFETSRYLGESYQPTMRIKTMRYAQLLSGFIYIVFVGLSLVIFDKLPAITETSIIDMSGKVAGILPFLLIIAAMLSQFSAAIADTVGAGGLFYEVSTKRIGQNTNYLVITAVAIGLLWVTDIFQIISLASRAFAFYYGIEALQASIKAYHQMREVYSRGRFLLFVVMTVLMFMASIFGVSV